VEVINDPKRTARYSRPFNTIIMVLTEVDVSLEKDGYFLRGKADLLMGGDGKLKILDFKTSQRPTDRPTLPEAY
jgi:ATP-dependent exoDNAse (exonuclease V) beta subunit